MGLKETTADIWSKAEPEVVFSCRLPVNLIQAFLEVSGQTSPKETADAQEQIH